jgi:hypothetical protein
MHEHDGVPVVELLEDRLQAGIVIFLVNVPLGAVGVAVAISLVLVPLTVGRTEGWPAWTWISFATAVPAEATLVLQRGLGLER